jgi:alkylation response protein AidB-like acyl-CoA dehydrogenase
MIDFELDSELELLRETARAFAQDRLRPRERTHESSRQVEPGVVRAYREIGLQELELPEAVGGAGLGPLARVVVLEELACGDAGAALALDSLGPALYPLLEFGGEEALRRLALPLLEVPGARAVLIWSPELARSGCAGGKLSAELPWVPADRVDLLVILGEDEACAVRQGFTLDSLRGAGMRAAGASSVRLDAAPVVASFSGPTPARRALARARLYVAAMLVGVMRASAEYSREYALERVAFGRPIAHHQALAFLIADMASALDGTRLLVQEAAWRLERGLGAAEACATAFVEAVEQSLFVTPNGVQILGGHGFMQDYPVEKYMREARVLGLLYGGSDAAREEAGQALGNLEAPTALPLGVGP